MHTLTAFWLPILLSAAAVWIASAVAWMALPHHKGDHKKLPNEDAFSAYVKSAGIPAGNYGFPHCGGHSKMKDPAFQKRWTDGPNGFLSVWGQISMGRNMVLTFLVYLVGGYVLAYLADSSGLRHGESFMAIFRFTGTAGILAYGFSFIPTQIWFAAYPRTILMNIIDGIVFGLTTGLIFAALRPAH